MENSVLEKPILNGSYRVIGTETRTGAASWRRPGLCCYLEEAWAVLLPAAQHRFCRMEMTAATSMAEHRVPDTTPSHLSH